MLDLRQLRYFVAVAEAEHVGRAAEQLHISQSPLSRQIAQLEKNLGLTLFERSQQRIRLTSDGRVFLTEAHALLRHADRLENLGRRLGRGEEGGLCIGYVADAMHTGVLPTALRTLRDQRPGIHVALYDQESAEQFEGLRQRSLDIALVRTPPSEDDPDLNTAPLLQDPLLLALPAEHPLAGQEELTPKPSTGSRGSRWATPTTRPGATRSSPRAWPPASPRTSVSTRPIHSQHWAWSPPVSASRSSRRA